MSDTPNRNMFPSVSIVMSSPVAESVGRGRVARLTRKRDAAMFERDAARDECSKWRANFADCLTTWERHPCTLAMSKHDAACPGWEGAR